MGQGEVLVAVGRFQGRPGAGDAERVDRLAGLDVHDAGEGLLVDLVLPRNLIALICFCSVTTKTTMTPLGRRLDLGLDVGELPQVVDALVVLGHGGRVERLPDPRADLVLNDAG